MSDRLRCWPVHLVEFVFIYVEHRRSRVDERSAAAEGSLHVAQWSGHRWQRRVENRDDGCSCSQKESQTTMRLPLKVLVAHDFPKSCPLRALHAHRRTPRVSINLSELLEARMKVNLSELHDALLIRSFSHQRASASGLTMCQFTDLPVCLVLCL